MELRNCAIKMKVVNDTAEQGISLIQLYNSSITYNEEQKQFLLQLVAAHRKKISTASKLNLMNYK